MTNTPEGNANFHAHCITDCRDACVLQPVRDGLGLVALETDELEPFDGPRTEKLRIIHDAMTNVCLQHSMNDQLYPSSPED